MKVHVCFTFFIKRKHLYELAINDTKALFVCW